MLGAVAWRIDEYERGLGSVAPSTRVAYRRDVEQFVEWVAHRVGTLSAG